MSDATYRISLALESIAKAVDITLEATAGERVCFCLVVATNRGINDSLVQYVSNVEHSEGEVILKELLERWNQNMPDIPEHEKH